MVAVRFRTDGDARVIAARLGDCGRSVQRSGPALYIEGGLATVSRMVTRAMFRCPNVSLVAIAPVNGAA